MKPTTKIISGVFGCTVEQAKGGLLRNAASMRRLSPRQLKQWGKTKREALEIASEYEKRARV